MKHIFLFFFFNDTPTTEIYTLSLHDALPISLSIGQLADQRDVVQRYASHHPVRPLPACMHQQEQVSLRSEEHTSELQSRRDLVCRLLLEKKKQISQR